MSPQQQWPPCGLYVTTRELAGRELELPPGRLVMFHNHSRNAQPVVQRPKARVDGIWVFGDEGFCVDHDPDFVEGLLPLPPQGIYYVKDNFAIDSQPFPQGCLVKLGYTLTGRPLLFKGRWIDGVAVFPQQGIKLFDSWVLPFLRPLSHALDRDDSPQTLVRH